MLDFISPVQIGVTIIGSLFVSVSSTIFTNWWLKSKEKRKTSNGLFRLYRSILANDVETITEALNNNKEVIQFKLLRLTMDITLSDYIQIFAIQPIAADRLMYITSWRNQYSDKTLPLKKENALELIKKLNEEISFLDVVISGIESKEQGILQKLKSK